MVSVVWLEEEIAQYGKKKFYPALSVERGIKLDQ